MDLFSAKFLLVGVVALVVLGPERLPSAARTIGSLLSDYRRISAEIRTHAAGAIDASGLRQPLDELRQPFEEMRKPLEEMRRPFREAGVSLATLASASPASHGLLVPAVAEAEPMGADAVPALAEAQPSAVPEPLSIQPVPAPPVPDRALVPG